LTLPPAVFANQFRPPNRSPMPMFLGDGFVSGEDNIFFLVHELFTGRFFIKNPAFFMRFEQKKRLDSEAPARLPRGH
jgi:hypothetical protein